MPLTLAWHCSKVEKPQFSVPPPLEYSAHHDALAGVCVSTAGIITSAATITLALKRIASLLILIANNLISTRQARYCPMVLLQTRPRRHRLKETGCASRSSSDRIGPSRWVAITNSREAQPHRLGIVAVRSQPLVNKPARLQLHIVATISSNRTPSI